MTGRRCASVMRAKLISFGSHQCSLDDEARKIFFQNVFPQPSSIRLLLWLGGISAQGPGRLYIVNGIMRQDQYIEMLRARLLPQMAEWFPNGEGVSMQDEAPCHTAKRVIQFLRQEKISLLSWPGNSPDMNPIENFWHLLKRKVNAMKPTTKRSLIECILQIWHHDQDICDMCPRLIQRMPKRVAQVISSKGGYTKY